MWGALSAEGSQARLGESPPFQPPDHFPCLPTAALLWIQRQSSQA